MSRETKGQFHCHTMYSIGADSTVSIDEFIKRAQELGVKNLTKTDHGTLMGTDEFVDKSLSCGINPIPGVEFYVRFHGHKKDLSFTGLPLDKRYHLIIIPKNYEGFVSISHALRDCNMHLESLKKNKGQSADDDSKNKSYEYPVMNDEILVKYFKDNHNVIASSACIQGPVAAILLQNEWTKKRNRVHEVGCQVYRFDHEVYTSSSSQLLSEKEKLKERKKQKTADTKGMKKPQITKIVKLKSKLAQMDENDAKYAKTKSDLEFAESVFEKACVAAKKADKEIVLIEAAIKCLVKRIDASKNGEKAYQQHKKKLDAAVLYPQGEVEAEADAMLRYLISVFPEFYMEMQNHGLEEELYVMPKLVKLAEKYNIPLIAANDSHMTDSSEDSVEARRILRFNYFSKSQKASQADKEMYMKSSDELFEALSKAIGDVKAEEAVRNMDILDTCRVEFPEKSHYPKVNSGLSFDELLQEARIKKIEAGEWNNVYEKRLAHEVSVIKNMGYVDYHLVVRDFCFMGRVLGKVPKDMRDKMPDDFSKIESWVKENGFNDGEGIGPGRGSAAGSLVCYLLGITNIDPIKYNLLFERFLNPERVSMPDIDTDVATSLRPYVIKYIRWRYGENAVCSIATETMYAAKGAVKMAGRERASQLHGNNKELIREYNSKISFPLADMIPEGPNETIAAHDAQFSEIIKKESNSDIANEKKIVWTHAKLLEGKLQTTGVHAGGVVISDNKDVNDYVPLAWNSEKNVWVAQCDMVQCEEKHGLIKMDLLGLNTLDCISDTITLVKKHKGVSIDIDKIPFEPEVFSEIYAKGNTNSVFQVESSGMKDMLKKFKPTCFEDIILLVASYRPGPMQYLPDIIDVKNGRKKISYKTPELESILCTTYGATVYQEEVMQIFQKLAGYSLGDADIVRRYMSKKKMDKLVHEREAFIHGDKRVDKNGNERIIDGCVKRGINEKIANQLFDEMIDFAKYAFNKSHAAAYAVVSYQTAWLKYHYPVEFLCAMFNNKSQDAYKPLLADMAYYGIKLLPPDINRSYYDFVIEDDGIRYGIAGIKGLGESFKAVMNTICRVRQNGDYVSVSDFMKRNLVIKEDNFFGIPFKAVRILAAVGAFDRINGSRKNIVTTIDSILKEKSSFPKNSLVEDKIAIQNAVYEKLDATDIGKKDSAYNISQEMEYLDTIVSERPLDKYENDGVYKCTPIADLEPDTQCSIFGYVTDIEYKLTKKGTKMAILNIQGKTGTCHALKFEGYQDGNLEELEKYNHKVIRLSGKTSNDGSLFVREVRFLYADNHKYAYQMILDTYEKTKQVMQIRGNDHTDRDADVNVTFCYSKNGHPLSLPCTKTVKFTKKELSQAKVLGVLMDYDD